METVSVNSIKLQFSDGRAAVLGLDDVNKTLRQVGVYVALVDIPEEAKAILKSPEGRKLTEAEKKKLFGIFSLTRDDLLELIRLAGRKPCVEGGGNLEILAVNGGAYPFIGNYGERTEEERTENILTYGKLHFNTSEDNTGVDEVMTVMAGGSFVWFFVLPDGTVAKLVVEEIGLADGAVRVSYPGTVIHGGYFPKKGINVMYAHGPKAFELRYSGEIKHSGLLNTNPWIDFTKKTPKLLDEIKTRN